MHIPTFGEGLGLRGPGANGGGGAFCAPSILNVGDGILGEAARGTAIDPCTCIVLALPMWRSCEATRTGAEDTESVVALASATLKRVDDKGGASKR